MHFFTIITGATAIIYSKGVYQQADMYARGEAVYAKRGSGFIKLSTGGSTSSPSVRWAEFDAGETAIITEVEGIRAPKYQGEKNISKVAAE